MWLLEKFYRHVVALYFYWTVLFEQRFLYLEPTNVLEQIFPACKYWLHYAAYFARILLGSQINTGTAVNLSVSHVFWSLEAVSISTSQTWGASAFPSHVVLQSPGLLILQSFGPLSLGSRVFVCRQGKRGRQLGFVFHFAVFSFLELCWSSQLLLSPSLVCL